MTLIVRNKSSVDMAYVLDYIISMPWCVDRIVRCYLSGGIEIVSRLNKQCGTLIFDVRDLEAL